MLKKVMFEETIRCRDSLLFLLGGFLGIGLNHLSRDSRHGVLSQECNQYILCEKVLQLVVMRRI